MVSIIVSDDEKYPDFKLDSLTATEGIALKLRANIPNRKAFSAGLDEDDPEAWRALVWILRTRAANEAGETPPRLSETDFPWGSCRFEFNEDELARIQKAMKAQDAGEEPVAEEPEESPTEASPAT